jgi:G2/mitotic-specific cyclin-B, other
MRSSEVSSKQPSLLATITAPVSDVKTKRLLAFKQQLKEHLEKTTDPVDLPDI